MRLPSAATPHGEGTHVIVQIHNGERKQDASRKKQETGRIKRSKTAIAR